MDTLILGAEIGGTKLQLALGRPSGEILETRRGVAPAEQGAGGILGWFEREVPAALERAEDLDGTVRAMGVGFGGPVDSATGRALASFQVAGWEDIALRHWFEERFGLPTIVSNDTNAGGWAEYCLGAGQGTRHFFYTNIGSGIGGALILDGRLHDGQGFGAGEMGHTYVPDWTADVPGAADKLENLCSGWAIERRVRAMPDPAPATPLGKRCAGAAAKITCAMLGDAAREGDAVALAEIERVAQSIGLAITNVITLFHPERVALGGGVLLMGDVLLDPIRRFIDDHVFDPYRGHYEIVPCALGESVVLAGALLLAGALRTSA